jgi:hypothetical protein
MADFQDGLARSKILVGAKVRSHIDILRQGVTRGRFSDDWFWMRRRRSAEGASGTPIRFFGSLSVRAPFMNEWFASVEQISSWSYEGRVREGRTHCQRRWIAVFITHRLHRFSP